MKRPSSTKAPKLQAGDKVQVADETHLYRFGHEAEVVAVAPRPRKDALVTVRFPDLHWHPTYAERHLTKLDPARATARANTRKSTSAPAPLPYEARLCPGGNSSLCEAEVLASPEAHADNSRRIVAQGDGETCEYVARACNSYHELLGFVRELVLDGRDTIWQPDWIALRMKAEGVLRRALITNRED